MRHPIAEEVDDYKAYRRCGREQRIAEQKGALKSGGLNYRFDDMNLNEIDFQEQFRRPSAVAKDPDHQFLEEPTKVSRTPSLHRTEVLDHDFARRHFDGSHEETKDTVACLSSGAERVQAKRTPPKKTRGRGHMEPVSALRNHGRHKHGQGESYDGGSDDAVTPAGPRHTGIVAPFSQVGSPQFYEVDWNPPPRRNETVGL